MSAFTSLRGRVDAVVISDYAKGFATAQVVSGVIAAAAVWEGIQSWRGDDCC